jgi:hypothetical protein
MSIGSGANDVFVVLRLRYRETDGRGDRDCGVSETAVNRALYGIKYTDRLPTSLLLQATASLSAERFRLWLLTERF